jgi:hypothetical protein
VKKILADRENQLTGDDFEKIFEFLPRSECRETLFISLERLAETPLEEISFSNQVKILFNLGKLSKLHDERYVKLKKTIIKLLLHISNHLSALNKEDIGELLRFFTHNRSVNPVLLNKLCNITYKILDGHLADTDLKLVLRFSN